MKNSITEFMPWMSKLEQVLRQGARDYFQTVLEHEALAYVEEFSSALDEHGRRLVKRNGYLPERSITTPIGSLKFKQPRVFDRREGCKFSSNILPKYMRKAPSLEALIPVLYLKGLSTNDFPVALESLLGPDYKGFSPKTVERLKESWIDEYKEWNQRDLSSKECTDIWADGIYFKSRLSDVEDRKFCFLIIMGATSEGKKELIGVLDGIRESKDSWKMLLYRLNNMHMKPPKLAVGDGALGFWGAISEVWPETKHQRCWVHKTANILDKMPKSVQPKAKSMIHDIYLAATKEKAQKAYKLFLKLFHEKYPGACGCLQKDYDELFSFYDFPALHWQHIRSTNPIESLFATVMLRTKRTKGCGSRLATLTMVFKLCKEASKKWRRLQGYKKLALVHKNVVFIDGYTKEEWEEKALLEEQAA